MPRYANPWHNPNAPEYGPAVYETDAKPISYGGFTIYERIKGKVWDVVKCGECVTQRAGMNGAKRYVDEQLKGGA